MPTFSGKKHVLHEPGRQLQLRGNIGKHKGAQAERCGGRRMPWH
ncbi:MAG: phage DNA packaging protein J [Treponema sp.]|nr:phage DNA packaging protein J [Treponema sp.]